MVRLLEQPTVRLRQILQGRSPGSEIPVGVGGYFQDPHKMEYPSITSLPYPRGWLADGPPAGSLIESKGEVLRWLGAPWVTIA